MGEDVYWENVPRAFAIPVNPTGDIHAYADRVELLDFGFNFKCRIKSNDNNISVCKSVILL